MSDAPLRADRRLPRREDTKQAGNETVGHGTRPTARAYLAAVFHGVKAWRRAGRATSINDFKPFHAASEKRARSFEREARRAKNAPAHAVSQLEVLGREAITWRAETRRRRAVTALPAPLRSS